MGDPILAIDFDHCDAVVVERTHGEVNEAYRAFDNNRRFFGYGNSPEEAIANMIANGHAMLDRIKVAADNYFALQVPGAPKPDDDLPPAFSDPAKMFWLFKHAVAQLKWVVPDELRQLFSQTPVSVVSKRTSTHLRKAQSFEKWRLKDGIVEKSHVTSLFTFESGVTLESRLNFLVAAEPQVIQYLNHTVNPK